MDYIHEITEETIDKMKNRYYRGNKEIKVGDKFIYAFVTTPGDKEGSINLNLTPFILDGKLFFELKDKKTL